MTGAPGVPAANPWPLYPSGVAPLDRPGYFSPESVRNRPEGRMFFNVTNVTLTPYLVDRGHPLFTGASVIVAPGGAYKWITWDAEGTDIAAWLNSIGVSAFLLKYRVPFRPWLEPGALSCCPATPRCCAPADRSPDYTDVRAARGPLIDAQRALSVLRARAPSLGLNATAVGFMGFSAGGHLGAQLGTTGLRRRLYARIDSADDAAWRAPDWLILVYPAYLVPTGRDVTPSDRAVTLNVTAEHPPPSCCRARTAASRTARSTTISPSRRPPPPRPMRAPPALFDTPRGGRRTEPAALRAIAHHARSSHPRAGTPRTRTSCTSTRTVPSRPGTASAAACARRSRRTSARGPSTRGRSCRSWALRHVDLRQGRLSTSPAPVVSVAQKRSSDTS